MALRVDGWTGFVSMKAILTQLGITETVNSQFLHTLRNYIYVYVFGDRISEMVLGGIAMANPGCPPGEMTGYELVYQYYQRYRLSNRGLPINIVIGSTIRLRCFLIGFRQEITDPSTGLAQFGLRIRYVPRRVVTEGQPGSRLSLFHVQGFAS